MYFKIVVRSKKQYAVNMVAEQIGIKALDQARDRLNLPEMSAALLTSHVDNLYTDVDITIDENIARDSGHFDNVCKVVVTVPPNFLNEFVDTDIATVRDNKNDAITGAYIVREVNTQKILDAWCHAGHPLNWGIEDEPTA